MWWAVTEALYVGGAGVAIIGGLYWKKGTTAGAWAGLLTGSCLVTGGILARQIWGEGFPLNGAQISFFGSISACLVYFIVSLLTCREDFNMDRMLHRGKYAIADEKRLEPAKPAKVKWSKIIGIDDHFTRGDKLLASGLFSWTMLWLTVFVVGTIWNLVAPWPLHVWSHFWFIVGIGIPIVFTLITAVWFSWGGIRDMIEFFKRLGAQRINHLDDGTVVAHHNLADRWNLDRDEGKLESSMQHIRKDT
jgi:SSS family solute:Na+ symporter